MFRYPRTFSVWLVGLFAIVATSSMNAESCDSSSGQISDSAGFTSAKKGTKKRKPRKRNPQLVVVKEDTAVARPETEASAPEIVAIPSPHPETLAQIESQNVLPAQPQIGSSVISPQDELPSSAPTITLLPTPPKKFQGVVRRLCHPVKGKKFYLAVRWKKGNSQNIAAYRVYVNGKCEKEILATKKPVFQVLRHTRHVRKVYEISSVDKDGNESSKKPLDVSKKSSHEPLCACRIRGCVTDFTNLTPEYLYTLTKEQIIDVLQKVRTEVLKAQDRSEKHVSHRP